jgi:outer membrane protein OmpA-like peptidoglycan-associated protein
MRDTLKTTRGLGRPLGLLAGLVLLGGLVGCATPMGPTPAMEQARAEFARARDQGVPEQAPVEFDKAARMLRQAAQAEAPAEMDRRAALARDQIAIAAAVARKNQAEAELEELEEEKQRVLLDTREAEVERARQQAEERAREAEREAREAEMARQEAESARAEAEAARRQAEAARREAEALKEQLTELQARETERGLVLTLGDVLFETGKADLMAGAARSIDKLAEFLRENPERSVLVEGHTDSTGGESFNLSLSQRRADAVRSALLARGIAPDRIVARGYGEQYPVADNNTSAGRQQNRRVEIVILDEGVDPGEMLR